MTAYGISCTLKAEIRAKPRICPAQTIGKHIQKIFVEVQHIKQYIAAVCVAAVEPRAAVVQKIVWKRDEGVKALIKILRHYKTKVYFFIKPFVPLRIEDICKDGTRAVVDSRRVFFKAIHAVYFIFEIFQFGLGVLIHKFS